MRKISTLVFTIGLAFTAVPIAARVSLDEAQDICTERAVQFANSSIGRYGDGPRPELVQQNYRACVYAKSGAYPVLKPEFRATIFTLQNMLK